MHREARSCARTPHAQNCENEFGHNPKGNLGKFMHWIGQRKGKSASGLKWGENSLNIFIFLTLLFVFPSQQCPCSSPPPLMQSFPPISHSLGESVLTTHCIRDSAYSLGKAWLPTEHQPLKRMMLASHLNLSANVLVLETSHSWSFFFTEKTHSIHSHFFSICGSWHENTIPFKTLTKI